MKRFLLTLAVLALASGPVLAGPNAGGVLVVHNGGTLTSDEPPLPPTTPTCVEIVNQVPMGSTPGAISENLIWKVYAAFPPGSSPRLKMCGWGISYPPAGGGGVAIEHNDAQNLAVFYITSAGWPASNTEVGMSFTDGARTDTVSELWWFSGYGYAGTAGEPQLFSVVENSVPGNRVFGDDAHPTNEDPIAGYGSMGFGQPGFTPCPPDLSGACCFTDGACVMLLLQPCVEAGGAYYGGDCLPGMCPAPGACCLGDGSCVILHVEPCVEAGGSFLGGDCLPGLCPTPGACCFPDGFCSVITPAQCETSGGSYVGGACTTGLCPMPDGACCLTNGTCVVIQFLPCTSTQNGLYLGDGVACEPNPCPPYGACCQPSGYCHLTTQALCEDPNGTFVGGDCTPNLCPITTTGACCMPGGTCELETAFACATAGGWFIGGACTPDLCTSPGACCLVNGTCTLQTVDQCAAAGGLFMGPYSCDPNPCPIGGWGACCNEATGVCTITTQFGCAFTWLGPDVPCTTQTCVSPNPTERKSWGQIKNSYR